MRYRLLLFLALLTSGIIGAQPSVSFVVNSQTISEGAGSFQIAVTIANPDANATSVDIQVVGGNAIYGTNFTYGPVTVTFPGNSAFTQLFTVNVIDDSIEDGTQTVTFGLANATNNATVVSPSQFTVTMMDIDTPLLKVYPTTETQYDFAGSINVPVQLNRGVRDTTKVQLNLLPAVTTAVRGVDFIFNDTTLIWAPDSAGFISANISLINNPFYERERKIGIALTSPTNGAVLRDSIFLLTIPANPGYVQPGCSDLFFGQYIEGTGNNKALQIYNPTSVAIDLNVYSILISSNGGATMAKYPLSGSISSNGVFLAANSAASAAILDVANITNPFFHFDGTEAVALLHNTDTIDIIGQLHSLPGASGWQVVNGSTQQHTLIRNYYDHSGDTSWQISSSTWDSYPVDMFDSITFHHTSPCGTYGPNATVRFIGSGDTIPQIDTTIYISVEMNNPTSDTLIFNIATDDSLTTAIQFYGNDYLFTRNIVNCPPGNNIYRFYVVIFPNPQILPTKRVSFKFTHEPNNMVSIPDSTYNLYLTNNNKLIVSFLGAGYSYPKDAGRVQIPVVTSTFSPTPVTAEISLSSGSAVLGQDFLFNDTTITFPALSNDTEGVWVTLINNSIYEANKQINFNLTNVTNYTYSPVLGITGFTLTIINNDSLAGINESFSNNIVKVYPNPVFNKLILQTTENLNDISIRDVLGRTVAEVDNILVGSSSLDVSSLPAGVYFLMSYSKVLHSTKFVKVE